jgi:hypothetical protein
VGVWSPNITQQLFLRCRFGLSGKHNSRCLQQGIESITIPHGATMVIVVVPLRKIASILPGVRRIGEHSRRKQATEKHALKRRMLVNMYFTLDKYVRTSYLISLGRTMAAPFRNPPCSVKERLPDLPSPGNERQQNRSGHPNSPPKKPPKKKETHPCQQQ